MRLKEIHIFGDCLEAIGIPDGGYAIVDRDAKPRIFDVVWCNNELCAVNGFLKQILCRPGRIRLSARGISTDPKTTFSQ